jgi:hypothetical protein
LVSRKSHFVWIALCLAACARLKSGAVAPPAEETPGASTAPAAQDGTPSTHDPLEAREDLPPERRALVFVDGKERWVDAEAISQAGYTLVDLRDAWTPLIFREQFDDAGEPLHNRYRRVFLGLANDQLDNDGVPLEAGRKNYLELYGIFPSLSVLRARFVTDAERVCHDQQSADVISAVETVSYVPPKKLAQDERKLAWLRVQLETARKRAKVETLRELAAAQPQFVAKVDLLEKRAAEKLAMAAVERRLECEELLSAKSKHKAGVYDEVMRLAVQKFQHKNMIYEANFLRRQTVDALARPPLQNDYDSLVRALRERVISAANIIEDGSGATSKIESPDLVGQYTSLTLQQLGISDAQSALAFFQRHGAEEFQTLRAAIKLPARPAYYADHMELSILVDRGDVWYDLPFDDAGNFKLPQRKRYPSLTLYVMHEGKNIPLARWRTTIGGWRSDQATNGYEYYRYKGSDVGPRVIRQIVSGPVWVAPPSTPIRTLVKGKVINGAAVKVVNYDELGPGYHSAYGVVAGYVVTHVLNGRPDFDNGVRGLGSSDYLSIYSPQGYSHGCHRLPNHIAVRLYSFILAHRKKMVLGDQPLGFSRQFLQGETVYEMRIPSRGYAFQLDPPLPVRVLEGQIKGAQKTPILGYVEKPNVVYPGPPPVEADSPEARAGGGAEDPAAPVTPPQAVPQPVPAPAAPTP